MLPYDIFPLSCKLLYKCYDSNVQGITENIIRNNINSVSRNSPIALVVGASGFIGSYISEELLKKNIQVIGVDNFSTGEKENLSEAIKSRKFQLINTDASSLNLEVPRLDYIFITAGSEWDISKILNIANNHKSKVVFISDIGLYDRNISSALVWYKNSEEKIANFAMENNLNARVVRMGAVFGPRMHFRYGDPVVRLIQATLLGEIQKESTALEFSSRALYIADAADLIIKSMLSGSTAQKIFDGVNDPVKVYEIKQILLDPLWHETRGFIPSELPPWTTPNLANTKKHLSWKPKTNIVTALRSTLHFFKENEIHVPKLEVNYNPEPESPTVHPEEENEWKVKVNEWKKDVEIDIKKSEIKKSKFLSVKNFINLVLWVVITYGLIYPILGILWNGYQFRENILSAEVSLSEGELGESLNNIQSAEGNLNFINGLVGSLKLPLQVGILNKRLLVIKDYLIFYDSTLESVRKSLTGAKDLYESFKPISGEYDTNLKDQIDNANSELEAAHSGLSEIKLNLQRTGIKKLPFINPDIYIKLTSQNRTLARFLPQVVSGEKSYLVIIEDGSRLVGSGGKILSASRIDFNAGKFKQLETKTASLIDKELTISTNPPQILKSDLNIQKGQFQYSNFDADFPTAAKMMSWYYNKSEGEVVDGVITIDVQSLEKLLRIIGPVSLEDQGKLADSKNLKELLEKDKDDRIASLLSNKLLNKLFFVPDINWPEIINWFGSNIETKDIQAYFEDNRIFAYLLSEGISGSIPRPSKDQSDLISIIETSVGEEKSNAALDRKLELATKIDNHGNLSHNLRVGYINGNGKNISNKLRMRVYIPAGSKVTRAFIGEIDLMKNSTSTIEYGRLVYSFVFEIKPKEQLSLNFDYTVPIKLNLQSDKINYRLDVIKQPGTLSDPFEWRITYPESIKTSSQTNIITDLKKDRSFAVDFTK